MRRPIQGHGYLDAPVGMAPHPDRLVALENDPVAVILGNLQDGVVRIDVTGIFCLEGSNLFQVVFLEDILALNNCKRSARRRRRPSGHRWKAEDDTFPTVPE